MGLITRQYHFINGQIADGGQVETEISKLFDLVNGNIDNANIKPNSVGTSNIVDLAITEGKIADLAVTTGKIADLAVATGKIADLAVTLEKLADGSISSDKLLDGAVITSKIADGNVTTSKIADGAIDVNKLASNIDASGKGFKAASATSATSATNANYATSAGNADTVDGYHASSFLRDNGHSFGGNNSVGYVRFTNGLIIQWGLSGTVPNYDTSITVTFPIAFPNACFQVVGAADLAFNQGFGIHSITTTSFQIRSRDNDGTFKVHWIAIGY